jgi:REP element-mobilizing transposase RayT
MPCPPRAADVSLHLIQRGNNRQACFFADGGLPLFYLDWLNEHAGKTGCRAHAYVLMTNHVANHLFGASNYWLAFLMINWNVMKWSSRRDKLTAPEPAA